MRHLVILLCAFLLLARAPLPAQTPEVNFSEKASLSELTDHAISSLGRKALAIHPETWKHAETANFVYHYSTSLIAKPVAAEAEFYYRVIAAEMEKDTTTWERKSHIYIFEGDDEWSQFQTVGGLEPWTGGIHSMGDLFIPRDPKRKFKGNTLAHEVTHLVAYRFFGAGIPLWLNEGLAEYTATRWYASFMRARGYLARPRSPATPPESFLPIQKLTEAVSYPATDAEVVAFYSESERLVRFLSAADKHRFAQFLELMGKGARFDSALDKSFGTKFLNATELEKEFKPYAAKDYVDLPH